MSDNKVDDLIKHFLGAHDDSDLTQRMKDSLDDLPDDVKDRISTKLHLLGTTLLAQIYLRSVLAAPAHDTMKVNAVTVMLAALAKSFDFEKTNFTTFGGLKVSTPEEFIDNMLRGAKNVLGDIEVVDDRAIMKDLPKDAIVHPGSTANN